MLASCEVGAGLRGGRRIEDRIGDRHDLPADPSGLDSEPILEGVEFVERLVELPRLDQLLQMVPGVLDRAQLFDHLQALVHDVRQAEIEQCERTKEFVQFGSHFRHASR